MQKMKIIQPRHLNMALKSDDEFAKLLKCVQISNGGHGDYFPACTNTTDAETPYPTLDETRRASCGDDAAFISATDEMMREGATADELRHHAESRSALRVLHEPALRTTLLTQVRTVRSHSAPSIFSLKITSGSRG